MDDNQHFFASTFAAWHVAETREDAIKGAVQRTGRTLVDVQKPDGGIEVLSCRVPLGIRAAYHIVNHLPCPSTGRTDVEKHRVCGLRGKPQLVRKPPYDTL